MSPYSVAVIGAGRIVAGFCDPGDARILTHLRAVEAEPRLRCTGLFDADRGKAASEARRWQVPHAASLDELFAAPVDLAVIATPDETHADYLRELLQGRCRAVLCEKPLAKDIGAARAIVASYEERGCALAVNYQRRFEPTLMAAKAALAGGSYGKPVAGAVWYSKGIMHNGSHAIDVLRFLFGEVHGLTARRTTHDFTPDDPTVTGSIAFDAVDVALIGGDERLFSLFEIDLLFEKARLRYTLSGARLERYEVRDDPMFPGYVEMTRVADEETRLDRALLGRYAALADFLDGAAPLAYPASESLGTLEACHDLRALGARMPGARA